MDDQSAKSSAAEAVGWFLLTLVLASLVVMLEVVWATSDPPNGLLLLAVCVGGIGGGLRIRSPIARIVSSTNSRCPRWVTSQRKSFYQGS